MHQDTKLINEIYSQKLHGIIKEEDEISQSGNNKVSEPTSEGWWFANIVNVYGWEPVLVRRSHGHEHDALIYFTAGSDEGEKCSSVKEWIGPIKLPG
jgi:hypothetical protein